MLILIISFIIKDNNKNKTHSNDDETKVDQIANRIPSSLFFTYLQYP